MLILNIYGRCFMRFKILAAVLIIGGTTACNNGNSVSDGDNSPPVIQAITFNPPIVIAGRSCLVTCIAVDPDNDNLSYEWNTIGNTFGEGASRYFTPNACCSQPKIQLTVRDGRGGESDTLFDVPFQYEE
jgi:hypothetical protein